MSWNSSFIGINKDFSNDLVNLQTNLGLIFSESGEATSWQEATSSVASGKSVGFSQGWTIICDPFMFLDMAGGGFPTEGEIWTSTIEHGLAKCSSGSKAFGFILGGSSDTYGMTIYQDGKCVRRRLVQEGQTLIDFGNASEEEIKVFAEQPDEEFRVFGILKTFGLDYRKFDETPFTLYPSNSF